MLTCSPAALIDFAISKWEADSVLQIEDAYKWLFQAARGGEHMVLSREVAAGVLEKEWHTLGPALQGEALWEPLSPDDKLGRLNMRPFKDGGGTAGDLVDAFVAGSRAYSPGPEIFLSAWNELGARLKSGPSGQLTHSDWSHLNADLKPKCYPAISHSETYRADRQPAYRILLASEAHALKKAMDSGGLSIGSP